MGFSDALHAQMGMYRHYHTPGWRELLKDPSTEQGFPVWEATILMATKATPYYVAPPICDLIAGASAGFDLGEVFHLFDAPTPHGFVYLAHPVPIPAASLDTEMWQRHYPTGVARLRGFGWIYASDAGDPALVGQMIPLETPRSERESSYAILATFDTGHPHCPRVGYAALPRLGVPWSACVSGLTEDQTGLALLRIIATFFRFVQQELLTLSPARPTNRATLRRLREHIPDPVVRVVDLRKRARTDPQQHVDVTWHCRWLVRGHWRRQWYRGEGRHKNIWIEPHVKGPDDQPFKPPTRIGYKVVR
jgi:hypothetical protein